MLNKEIPYDPAILLLGVSPEGMKTSPHKNLYTKFIAALLKSEKLKQSKYPSANMDK